MNNSPCWLFRWRLPLVSLTVIALLPAAASAGTLLVANRSSHEVTFVDLERGEVTARVATGEGPHLLSNVSAGRVLATGYGEFPRPHEEPAASRPPFIEVLNARATLIDVATRRTLYDVTLDGCAKPHASWIVGDRGYVTCETEQEVLVIDLADGSTVQRLDTRQAGSHVLSHDPASGTLGVSNTGAGSVTLIDLASGSSRIVKLAPGSEGALAIDGSIWVANAFDGSVSIVDPVRAIESERIDVDCSFPIAFSRNSEETVWLACFASAELVAIDAARFVVQRRIKLDANPLHLLLHPSRALAWVAYPRENAVGEIDLETGNERRRIRVGIEPDGLRWAR